MPATGSMRLRSLFLTLPTRALTGQQIISSEGQGASSALSSGTSAGCSPSQAGHASGLSTAGMRLWSSAHNSFRCRRDDREAAYPLVRGRAPSFPQPGHAHQPIGQCAVFRSRRQKPALRPWWRSDRHWMRMSAGAVLIAKTRELSTAGERFVPAIVRSPMKNEKLQICVFCLCHFLYICGGAGTFAAAD
jgi:hypothetical protein